MEFIVTDNLATRLDQWLVEKTHWSRNQIQQLIKHNRITVNTKKTKAHYLVKENDTIGITLPEHDTAQQTLDLAPHIIAQTNDYIILNKPAGMSVHGPSQEVLHKIAYEPEPTVTDWLLSYLPDIKSVGENTDRPGIVHRLDKDVSGVMIIAKSNRFFTHIKNQFKARLVQKEYHALVYDEVIADSGTISLGITRGHHDKTIMIAVPKNTPDSKPAITDYEIITRYHHYTYMRLFPKTGRMHQLRVHCKAFNHPIVGDTKYSHHAHTQDDFTNLNQIWLHAHTITFTDLDNETVPYTAPIQTNLEDFRHSLKIKNNKTAS